MILVIEPDLYSLFFWSRPALCNGATEEKNLPSFFLCSSYSPTRPPGVGADARGAIGVRRASRAAQPRRLRIEIVL